MAVIDELVQANEAYARTFDRGHLPLPPARRLAVLACMDARIIPSKALGLEEGDAHVIRNAGGGPATRCARSSSPSACSAPASWP